MQPQTTTTSNATQSNNNLASSPAVDLSNTSATNGVRCAPTGRISIVARLIISPIQKRRRLWRSTTCSTSGRPWQSATRTNDARARVTGGSLPPRSRKTSSKEDKRGLARTRRVPQVRRGASPGEGTIRRASVRRCASGRIDLENVSCGGGIALFSVDD